MELQDIKEVKQRVKDYVNQGDPWHLIEMGAPDDEYNSQIDRVVSFLVNKKPDQAALVSELLYIFKTNEHELEQDKVEELASKLISVNV